MRLRFLILALAAVVALGGCDLWYSIFGNGDAVITSFSIDGIDGTAAIDASAHTVVVNVLPMDISTVIPEITVSDGATLTPAPAAPQDGVPVTYAVKAQNGTVSSWTVTVNVDYGISFLVDGTTKIVMTHGYVVNPSYSRYTADLIGNGHAAGYTYIGTTYIDSFDADQMVLGPAPVYTYLQFNGLTMGTYGPASVFFDYYYDATNFFHMYGNSDVTILVTAYGMLGEPIQGTFSCTAYDGMQQQHTITNGFFKAVSVDDSGYWANRNPG